MKRKTTKEILAESFRELAETHPADKITIQEIADNYDYSPATFYRHFKCGNGNRRAGHIEGAR